MPVATRPHPLLGQAFAQLDAAGASWAVLRGADELADPVGDVDLLATPAGWASVRAALARTGFVHLPAPGHGPHRFFFGYDGDGDRWLKIDVVVRIAFGQHQELATGWHDAVLGRRRRVGDVWRLDDRDEAWLHLLHDLLDKDLPVVRRELVQRLDREQQQAGDLVPDLGPEALSAVLSGGTAPAVVAAALRRHWSRPERAVAAVGNRARRRLHGGRRWPLGRGASVALLGPDGAGKSTLAAGLAATLPVHAVTVHMGLWRTTRPGEAMRSVPGGTTAVGIARAVRASLAARYHLARGRLVLLDRSALDLRLGDADRSAGGRVVAAVFTCLAPSPGLVLVLDAPGSLMHARKREHTADVLERRRQDYLRLAEGHAAAQVLDATQDAEQLRRSATAAVWESLARRGGR